MGIPTGKRRHRTSIFGKLVLQLQERIEHGDTLSVRWRDATAKDLTEEMDTTATMGMQMQLQGPVDQDKPPMGFKGKEKEPAHGADE